MGKTSKPINLLLDQSILDAAPEEWGKLIEQGHTINNMTMENTVIVAPYAMRMTAAMVKDLPKAIELLIKGARALQYPAGTMDWQKGKPKRVANTKKGKGKNSKKSVETHDGNEQGVDGRVGSTEGVLTASEASNT